MSHQPGRLSPQPEKRRGVDVATLAARTDAEPEVETADRPADHHARGHLVTAADRRCVDAPDHRIHAVAAGRPDDDVGDSPDRADESHGARHRCDDATTGFCGEFEAAVARTPCARRRPEPVDDRRSNRNDGGRRQAHDRGEGRDHRGTASEFGGGET